MSCQPSSFGGRARTTSSLSRSSGSAAEELGRNARHWRWQEVVSGSRIGRSSLRGSLRLGSGQCRKGSPGRCGTGRPILRGRVAPLRGWLGGLPRGRPCVGGAGTAQTRSAPRPSFPRAPALQQRKRRAAGYGYRNDPPTAAQGAWLAVGAGARRLRRGRCPHRTSACRGGRGRRPPAACADTFPTGRRSGGAEWKGLEPVRRARGGKIINPAYRGCADFFCCRAFLGVFCRG